MIRDIALYLEAQGCGTLEVDLFLGALPLSPRSCAAIQERPGMPPIDVFGDTAWEQPRWLVLVRDPAYVAARVRAERIYRELLAIANRSIGANVYGALMVRPPAHVDTDKNNDIVLGVSAEVWRTLTVLV